jgi:hypothetical protein
MLRTATLSRPDGAYHPAPPTRSSALTRLLIGLTPIC